MKRLTHITLTTVIMLLSLASCNDGRRTSPAIDVLGEETPHATKPKRQDTDKDTVTSTPQKGTGGTVVTHTIQGAEASKALSRLRNFRHRTVSKLFARDVADSLSVGRAELRVPRGSMERSKMLSVTPLDKGELPQLPAGMVNVTGDRNTSVSVSLKDGVAGYRLLPHGEHFVHEPATITVPYDSTLIPEGYTADDIHTYYYDELQGRWTMLRHKALDKDREVVMAETSHFTDVINGIIKVPESPETQNYVPTGISELKAADPAAGIATVSAPTPNQNGTASLGYTFELPKGRAGMQPSVGLQYSSDGGSSYVGYGWSLPVQSVDIETRWGVPRFDPNNESESYLLMGAKLGDRTYRTAEPPARKPNKRFHLLVEGGFARIIRRGDSPTNYTWEVTAKDGTTSYFGGIEGKIVDNAVIKDGDGNIVRWALYRTVDTHGNFVSYTYEHRDSTLYPKVYRYTGHGNEEGAYAVNFKYISGTRKDAMKSGRLRILQTDDALLERVEVSFNGEPIRGYALHHREGPFAKTLLDSIVQLDAKGARVAAQGFDYYDDVKGGMFGKAESWTSEADNKHEHLPLLQKAINGFSNELSMLGGGYSKGKTFGGGLFVGFGVSVATVNVGASYIQLKNENFGKVALIDIDGDGLPDKVFQARDGLCYRKNLSGETGNLIFAKSRMVKGIGEFSRGTSSNKTLNANAAVELPFVSPGVSYSQTWDKTETKIYMSDFNNDGLVDIANNGTVWFNRIGTDGLPTFVPSTKETPNPIIGRSAEIDSTFIPDYKAIRDSLEKESPLHDVVRVWRAPFSGTIHIASVVNKSTTYGDGIIYSVQKEENVLRRDSILNTGMRKDSLTTSVKAGERLFFRLQSRYSGAADSVAWSQRVRYSQIVGGNATYLGQDLSHYDATSDFLEGMTTGISLPKDGRVEIKAPYRKGRTEDHVTLVVRRKDLHGEHILMEKKLLAGTSVEDTFEDAFDVLAKDSVQLTFEMLTDAPLEWRNMSWKPTLRYVSTQDTLRVIPFRKMYNKPVLVRASRKVRKDLAKNQKYDPGVILVHKFKVKRQDRKNDTDTATVNVNFNKEDGTLLFKRKYTLTKGDSIKVDSLAIVDATLLEELCKGKTLATFSVDNELRSVAMAKVEVLRDSLVFKKDSITQETVLDHKERVLVDTVVCSVFSGYNSLNFGHLYRGWGQFGYNGNREYANRPIETSALTIDTDGYKSIAENYDKSHKKEDLAGLTEPSKQRFFVMGYNAMRKVYVGATDSAYVGASFQCSSRMGESEIRVDSVQYASGEGLSAPILQSKSSGGGVSATGSGPLKFGISGSKSWQKSHTGVAAMDINGDGYPDWIDEGNSRIRTQYTSQTGTLSQLSVKTDIPMPEFSSGANTLGISNDGAIAVSIGNRNRSEAGRTTSNSSPGDVSSMSNTNENPNKATTPTSNSTGQCEGQNASDGNAVSSLSVSASGNFSQGNSKTTRDWLDWNGDGLPDMVEGNTVRYNLGYGFTMHMPRGCQDMDATSNTTWGAGLGTKITILGNAEITGGFNGTKTTTHTDCSYADLNGDGMPDKIIRDDDKVKVAINTGTGFVDEAQDIQGSAGKNLATSVSLYGSGAFSFRVYLLFLKLSITPHITAAWSTGVSRTESALLDIDGDGLPDFVESAGPDALVVRRNLTGRTNLLRSVTLPFGGHVRVEYRQTLPSFAMPGRRWVMSAVETSGGYAENGATRMRNEFAYEGGYRDRRERDFFGFAKVITRQLDTQKDNAVYRTQVSEYGHNRNLYMHDLVTAETLYDAQGNKLQGTINTYEAVRQRNDSTSVFPALVSVRQTVYDNAGQGSMSTTVHNTYDAYGNLASYKETATDYELRADIAYHELRECHIVGLPRHIAVKDKAGRVYRERSTEVDGKGDITRITMHNGQLPSVYDMAYDAYGNLAALTKPANHKGQRMRYEYAYDGVLHQLVTGVKDAYGYASSTDYDCRWGAPLETRDINGNRMRYAYDDAGRPTAIVGPKELAAGKPYTVRFEYHPAGRWARTLHYAPEGDVETRTFADSLMRAVQTKRTGVVWKGGATHKVSIVSGRTVQDAFGRTLRAYWPTEEGFGSMGLYNKGVGDLQATTEYDAYDRPTKVTLPDGATTTTAYTIVDHDGEPMLETRVTDALGRHAESYTDEKGRNRETVQHAGGEDVRVSYGYDAVGQVLSVHHPNGKTTTYEYDLLGHKLKVNHPDAGEVTCTYDAAGNLLTKLTAELKKTISDKAAISYTYDYERLSEVLYPKNLFNRVTYTYGKPGAKYNRAGRLELVEDASGGEAYYYGNQGEVVKTVRSVMVSQADVRTYVHAATYDSHNRVRTMTYPDGEVVTYGYDAAGQVTSLRSTKQGKEETIVAQVGYDKDGHTIYTRMGNGTESTYAYDRQRERLQGMQLTANGDSIMQTQYKYDPVDNILGISNVITPKAPKKPKGFGGSGRTDGMGGPDAGKEKKEKPLGGAFSHAYAYDELNRLVKASGKAKGIGYAMDMSFGLMGEPLTKVQRTDSGSVAGSYALAYEYGDADHPTAPSQIGHERYTYDANGNPTLVEDDSLNTERRMAWDEENRLMALSDNGKTSRYTYNAAGDRVVKSHGYLEGVYVNGAPQGLTFHETEDYTIYPAPILSVTRQRFTKHYFIGDRRVASKIGAGIFQNAYGHGANVVTAGQKDYQMRMMQIERQREDYYRKLGTPPGVPTMKGAMAEPENTHEGYNTIIKELGDHSVPDGWIQRPKRNAVPGTPPGPPVQWDKAEDPDDVQPGYGYVPADTAREDIFYYHTDHLGSTSYITDAKANVAQFDAYLPYGELLVDEHSSTEEMPYKFNGKEFDQETGLYYYGARYMNPKTSLWYGVDLLAEKYPNITPYCYTDNNPVRYIDPNGMIKREYYDHDNMEHSGNLYKNYINFKDGGENVFNLFAHGNTTGFGYRGHTDLSTGKNAVNFLYGLIQNDSELKNSFAKHKGKDLIIVLYMCKTANFAERVSKDPRFKDVLIIAPNGDFKASINKYTTGMYNEIEIKKEYTNDILSPNDPSMKGVWKAYRNGENIKNYKGTSKPGSRGFDYSGNQPKKMVDGRKKKK